MLSEILMYFYISIFSSSYSFTLSKTPRCLSRWSCKATCAIHCKYTKAFSSLGMVHLALTNIIVE